MKIEIYRRVSAGIETTLRLYIHTADNSENRGHWHGYKSGIVQMEQKDNLSKEPLLMEPESIWITPKNIQDEINKRQREKPQI